MPPKKGQGNQAKLAPEPVVATSLLDGGDPIMSALTVIDKKARNLEKRRNKLTALQDIKNDGTAILDKDQAEAITKIKDVTIQLEMIRELQKQFSTIQTEYQKYRKRQQRSEKQQAKEAEYEAEKKAVSYTIRIQSMLYAMGDDDKENFRTGSDGAVKLSEDELTQVDELYKVINPTREDNPNYDRDVSAASEHLLLLMEGSPKETFNTTYKDLRDVLERIEESGYFSRPPQQSQDDQHDSEEDADDYKSADDHVVSESDDRTPSELKYSVEKVELVHEAPPPPPVAEHEGLTVQYLESTSINEPAPGENINQQMIGGNPPIVAQTGNMRNYMPSAPSPTFPALGSPILLTHDDGFSFMHESEVERKQSMPLSNSPLTTAQQMTHQAPPHTIQSQSAVTQNIGYSQYNSQGEQQPQQLQQQGGEVNIMGVTTGPLVNQTALKASSGQGTTDVTTGQPGPSIQHSFQSGGSMDTSTTGIMSSSAALPANQDAGMMVEGATTAVAEAVPYSNVLPSSTEAPPTGFRQQQQSQNQQNSYYRGSQQNKGGRGPSGGARRNGGQGSKGNYGGGRNGHGGYETQGQSYNSRNYGGGGGGYQQQRGGGRPNYRTNTGGQRRT